MGNATETAPPTAMHHRKSSQPNPAMSKRIHKSGPSLSSSHHSSIDSVKAASLTSSATTPGSAHPLPPMPPIPASAMTPLDHMRVLAHKRWTTFDHLARVYTGAGTTPFLGTVRILLEDLTLVYDNTRLRKRGWHLFVLGTSLGKLIASFGGGMDFVGSVVGLQQEYDAWVSSTTKSRLLFMGKKSDDGDGFVVPDHANYTFLDVRNIPFDLDYLQVFTTLCQILTRVYLTIHAYTFCDQPLWESVQKMDSKFKKWIGVAIRELDPIVRNVVRDEIKTMDPAVCGRGVDSWDVPSL